MEIVKVGLVVLTGLGSTWVAREATDRWLGTPAAATLVQAEPPESGPPPAAPAEKEGAARPQIGNVSREDQEEGAVRPPIGDVSREEMEEELKRAQAEIAGKPSQGELEEFRPSRPLPADLAISLPSDM